MSYLQTLKQNLKGHWMQGGYGRDDKLCLLGWMGQSARSLELNSIPDAEYDAVIKVVEEQFPDRINGCGPIACIPCFNDHDDTTETDVLMVLEKAQANLEEL